MKQPEYVDPWRAKDDADTLARAQEIRSDKARHKAAADHATRLAKAVGKPASKPTSKPSSSKKGK